MGEQFCNLDVSQTWLIPEELDNNCVLYCLLKVLRYLQNVQPSLVTISISQFPWLILLNVICNNLIHLTDLHYIHTSLLRECYPF